MLDPLLLAMLSPDRRLALAYAPRASKALFLGLFALDAKLEGIALSAREPMLGQLKLAWWREQVSKLPGDRPTGEPVLSGLAAWEGSGAELAVLVDGWEHRLGQDPLDAKTCLHFMQSRGQACASLANLLGASGEGARRAGECWALGDLLNSANHEGDQTLVTDFWRSIAQRPEVLTRNMRPLLVLQGLSKRALQRGGSAQGGGALLLAMRLGILGI